MTHPLEVVEAVARALVYDLDSLPDAAKKRALSEATALLDQIAPLLTAVKVKPLVFNPVITRGSMSFAEAVGGGYHLSIWKGEHRVWATGHAEIGIFMTPEAAKAAAQADYEARILAAVEAVPVAQAVEAERIACTEELQLAVAAARAEERVKTLEAVKDAIQCLANPADIPGGCVIPDTFDEGTSAAFEAVGDMLREATAIRKQEGV